MDTPEKPAEAATPTSPTTASEATPATTPEAATTPAPGTTTTTEEPSAETHSGKDAVGVEGYFAMRDAAFKAAESEQPPAEAAEPEASTAEPATTVEPATAASEPVAAVAEPAAPTPAADQPQEDKTPERIRLTGLKDGHLVAAANTIAREEGITFAEAFARVSAPKKAEEPAAAAPVDAPVQRTRDEIQADIAARKSEKKQAATDLDTGKMYDADEAIEALREELQRVETADSAKENERQAAAQTQFSTAVETSKAEAVKNWPESGEKESAFSKRMEELADAYEKDPNLKHHVFESDAPFYFADLVAKEMGLLPKHLRKEAAATPSATSTQPSTPTATKPAPLNQRAVVRPTQPAASPASGAARTTQEAPTDTLGLDNIRSPYDYEQAKERLMKELHPQPA